MVSSCYASSVTAAPSQVTEQTPGCAQLQEYPSSQSLFESKCSPAWGALCWLLPLYRPAEAAAQTKDLNTDWDILLLTKQNLRATETSSSVTDTAQGLRARCSGHCQIFALTRALSQQNACTEIPLQMAKFLNYVHPYKEYPSQPSKNSVFNLPGTNIWTYLSDHRFLSAFWTQIPDPAQPSQIMLTSCYMKWNLLSPNNYASKVH